MDTAVVKMLSVTGKEVKVKVPGDTMGESANMDCCSNVIGTPVSVITVRNGLCLDRCHC